MDLRQLDAFVAVIEHGSFSAAARALHTVQSNVSTHVRRLEEELGVTLVDRRRGGPTDEGAAVLERARRVGHELAAIEADVSSLGAQVTGTVRLGVIGTTGRWLAPQLFDRVDGAHPGVRVVMVEATTTSLVPQIEDNRLDLAIVNLPVSSRGVTAEELFDEDRVLAAPRDHPLAHRSEVDLAELAEHPLLLEPEGTGFRDALDARLAESGLELRARAEVDGMRLLTSLVLSGFGAAVLPASAVTADRDRSDADDGGTSWVIRSIAGLPRRRVGLVRPRRGELSRPAAVVRDLVVELATEAAGQRTGIHECEGTRASG